MYIKADISLLCRKTNQLMFITTTNTSKHSIANVCLQFHFQTVTVFGTKTLAVLLEETTP